MDKTFDKYLIETPLLDYSNEIIQELIKAKGWLSMPLFERLKSIYNYVRDEILFGYNVDDDIKASEVLKDGYGQCNSKGILFMSLLRGASIPCRIHGFYIDKKLQKGAMKELVYLFSPRKVLHSYVEVYFEDKWYKLEAFILDVAYLRNLQIKFKDCHGPFFGYGVASKDLQHPVIDFNRNDTFIQSEGIVEDLGIYNCPDELFKNYHQKMSHVKAFLFRHIGRHAMNRNVKMIRRKG